MMYLMLSHIQLDDKVVSTYKDLSVGGIPCLIEKSSIFIISDFVGPLHCLLTHSYYFVYLLLVHISHRNPIKYNCVCLLLSSQNSLECLTVESVVLQQ